MGRPPVVQPVPLLFVLLLLLLHLCSVGCALRAPDFQISAAEDATFTSISVGSTEVPFRFALDTRATYSAVLSTDCPQCPTGTTSYDPLFSNTSVVQPCGAGCYFCEPDRAGLNACGLTMALSFDHEIRGVLVADSWNLSSGVVVPAMPFIAGDFWSPGPQIVTDDNHEQLALNGVLGLGPQSRVLPVLAAALQAPSHALTLCLGPYGGRGYIGLDPASAADVLYRASAYAEAALDETTPHLWAMQLQSLSVDRSATTSRMPPSNIEAVLSPVTLALASPAALELPLEAWNWLRDTMWSLYCSGGQKLFGLCPQDQYDTSLFDISDGPVCFFLSSPELAQYPNITIELAGANPLIPVRLTLTPHDYLLLTERGYCLNVQPFASAQQSGVVLGAQVLGQYFLQLDAGAGVVGFAHSTMECSLAKYVVNIYSGDQQTGVTGSLLGDSLKVQVLDAASNVPVPGLFVRWQVLGSGEHELEDTVQVTDADGIARTGLKLGPNPAQFLVSASVDFALNSPIFFSGSSKSSSLLLVVNIAATVFLACIVGAMAFTHFQVEKVRAAKQAAKEAAAAAAAAEKAADAPAESWFPRRDPAASASVLNLNASMRSFPPAAAAAAFGRSM